jgi:SAM-dependent methyltransferase
MTSRAEIAERFAALGPWSTRFVVDGEAFGGALDYSDDRRVATFFHWFGVPRTILELSSFEGAHTLELAAPGTSENVFGLDGRADNVERARLVAELLGRGNIEFAVEDLEHAELARYGRFDAVFCAGLLYHLVSPWRLLAEIGTVSDRLFLDTHYWPWPPPAEVDGYLGGWAEERVESTPLASGSAASGPVSPPDGRRRGSGSERAGGTRPRSYQRR